MALQDIPRRVFLDSSVLQALHEYASFVYENRELSANARILNTPNGHHHLKALRSIMQADSRAQFEFALSGNSLTEVAGKRDQSYLQWAVMVLERWEQCLEDSGFGGSPAVAGLLCTRNFGYLAYGDRELLKDAVGLGCDAFLTMDARLHRNALHLENSIGMRILTPASMWTLLKPWAALFY